MVDNAPSGGHPATAVSGRMALRVIAEAAGARKRAVARAALASGDVAPYVLPNPTASP